MPSLEASLSQSERTIKRLDWQIGRGKTLIKHLLKVYKSRFQPDVAVDEDPDQAVYVELLFDMVIPKDDLRQVAGILDFVEIL